MASIPDGTYTIKNNSTGKMVNLAEGLIAPYTPIIAWDNIPNAGNQKWVAKFTGTNTYTIRSNLDTGAWASAAIHYKGGEVANSSRSELYNITAVSGGHKVTLPGGALGWTHANTNDAAGIQLTLQPPGSANEVWTFTSTT